MVYAERSKKVPPKRALAPGEILSQSSIQGGNVGVLEKSTAIVESDRAHSGSSTDGCGQKGGS
ncbi:hypothetical protein C3B54_11402 [Pontimonas salivibrio]|uniref:Uncharacterized protein n=1 Tax=Pontimonas salivibrio TaxID=1159327 RepID=A0A2L2BP25_9MICO|nr:hypothetical protein C3B54_11402 [Pontimonas salivibrio]